MFLVFFQATGHQPGPSVFGLGRCDPGRRWPGPDGVLVSCKCVRFADLHKQVLDCEDEFIEERPAY